MSHLFHQILVQHLYFVYLSSQSIYPQSVLLIGSETKIDQFLHHRPDFILE